ncbi:MAG: cytochrome c-type biogenesis protein CcmH [SAR324 cluster bacterium]|jgi:cytochrome c-type biogenesis protein CcmH/NrfF|nr:cytochrome c-type biogenesis protein CcmH [SAR324 cluster bacterium]MCH2267129.1 cytochrome c-type biogenesis protein CcmH [SAR324 cluster bacterium]
MFNFRFITVIITLIILSGTLSVSLAEEGEKFSARFRKLSDELRCPTCQGLSVKDSEAGFSNSIKDKIRELMKNGKSDEEIIAYFVKRYGEWILRSPTKQGFNLLLWILPGAGIVIGLFVVFLRAKRRTNNPENEELAQLTAEEERKIKEDLGRFEGG